MKAYNIVFIFTISISTTSCLMEKFYPILFVNDSNFEIEFYFAKPPNSAKHYPDTTLPDKKPILLSVTVQKNRTGYFDMPYDIFFNALPSDTLSIFVFDADTLNEYPWEIIRDEYKILRRYDLSYQDLEQSNWTVTYP